MTVYARGIDYAWKHPNPQAIKDAGFDFVVRYYSRDPSKNLTRAEADALAAVGLWIVGNWEHGAQDALGGNAAGIANARLARSLADACGQPRNRPIYESDDWDVTPAQEATITDYLRGWDSEIGVAQVGEYAGFYPLRVQRDAGVTSWEWQPRAWSGGQWEPRVNIRQTGTAMVGGVLVDTNEAWSPDYGQWQPGRLPEGVAVMDWHDTNDGAHTRPNSYANIIGDQGSLRDWWYGTDAQPGTNPPPSGSHLDALVKGVALLPGIAEQLGKLTAPVPASVDLAALEALIEQHLASGSVPSVIAVAVAKHLGADLSAG